MNEVLVSIIMPTYNRAYIIGEAVMSVINQSYQNWELIVIDDASEDNTEEVVNRFCDSRIKYYRNVKNSGANFSRNRGCEIAQGQYLAFLDSDNIWNVDKLEIEMEALKDSNDQIAFVFCREEIVANRSQIVPGDDFKITDLKDIIRQRNVVDTNTVIIKRKVFEFVGGFDNEMPRFQDWELFFRILIVFGYQAIYIPQILDCNVLQRNSISNCYEKYIDGMCVFFVKHRKYFVDELMIGKLLLIYENAKTLEEKKCYMSKLEYYFPKLQIEPNNFVKLTFDYYAREYRYYNCLLNWNLKKVRGENIFPEFMKSSKLQIAIYGLGKWGELVFGEMQKQGLNVVCGIDIKATHFHGLKVVKPFEIPKEIDLIVVTVFQEMEVIRKEISPYYAGEILSIKELIER